MNLKMEQIMKKLAYLSAAVLAAVTVFSCNRAIEPEESATPDSEKETLTFRAVLQQPDTKADLNTDYAVVWQEGDQIAVFNGTDWATSAALTASDIQNNGRYAEFDVTIDAASTYWAVYPASAAPSAAITGDNIPVTLPAVQTIASGNSVAKDALVQVCKTDDKDNMVFQNVTSLVEFTAPEAVDGYVCFEAFNESDAALSIAGAATVNAETPAAVTGNATRVIVKGSFSAGQNYFAVVYPQSEVAKFRFAFSKEDTDNGTMKAFRTGSTESALEFPLNGGNKFSDLGTLTWLGPLSSKKDLDKWAKYSTYYLADETVKLGADIDYEGGTWTPVNGNANNGHFAGLFDGQNLSIYNIVIDPSEQYSGFFSTIACDTPILRVKNLKFGYNPSTGEADGQSILKTTNSTTERLGVLAGFVSACIIEGIHNYIPVEDAGSVAVQAGGIVGRCAKAAQLSNCYNYASIKCTNTADKTHYISGIVGVAGDSDIIVNNCSNYGNLSKEESGSGTTFIGGIIGRTGASKHGIRIADCQNYGQLKTTYNLKAQLFMGGIISMDNTTDNSSKPNLVVENCQNDGTIICTSLSACAKMGIGGIVGYINSYTRISNCINLGTISKPKNHNGITSNFGGIVGYFGGDENCYIKNCTNGKASDNSKGSLTDSIQTTTTGTTLVYFGGIVGHQESGLIENCINYGTISTKSSTDGVHEYSGGIVGGNSLGLISGCSNYGSLSSTNTADDCCTGGIVGLQSGDSSISYGDDCTVNTSISCGNISKTGLVVGSYSSTSTTCIGSSASPIEIGASTINTTTIDASNYQSYLAGSSAGITASGVASGLNTIWATFVSE